LFLDNSGFCLKATRDSAYRLPLCIVGCVTDFRDQLSFRRVIRQTAITNKVQEIRVIDGDWREGLFEAFDKLVDIEICKQPARVPENNKLLRCFQYLKTETISVGEYCWNGDCVNCQIWYEDEGGEIKSALACRMYVTPGLVITDVSSQLREDLA
jgi:hypothetical protein